MVTVALHQSSVCGGGPGLRGLADQDSDGISRPQNGRWGRSMIHPQQVQARLFRAQDLALRRIVVLKRRHTRVERTVGRAFQRDRLPIQHEATVCKAELAIAERLGDVVEKIAPLPKGDFGLIEHRSGG